MPRPLSQALNRHGLQVLGHCQTAPADNLPQDGTIVLIGPDEPSFWPKFTPSPEYQDRQPNPLDRWSHRVLSGLANEYGGTALFPFGGPPFQPIFRWALRTGRFWSSPIGFLVHDRAGLFVSFRGALLIHQYRAPEPQPRQSPCETCTDQPCKTACPVAAFQSGYDVATCKSHLADPAGSDCMSLGCRSRRACPIGQTHRLPAQAHHHMKAFL